jgi:hypothetical protein
MGMKSTRTPNEKEVKEIHDLLNEPPATFDCGKLCVLEGQGPLCCVTEEAVPSVYHWEWKYLKKRTKMWTRWHPRTESERREFLDLKADCDVYVKCKGAADCDRRYRSFVCRVFPLEPYIENDWTMSGVIFNTDFDHACPLAKRPKELRTAFVKAVIKGWGWLIGVEPEMHEIFRDWSQVLRRRNGQLNQPIRGFDLDARWTILRPGRPGPSRRNRRIGRRPA